MPRPRCPAVPLCRYADPLIADLRKRIPAALEEFDADAIHDARVSTRRLRAAIDLLDPAVPAKLLAPLRKTLRRLRRTLGPLRDIDVMLRTLEPLLDHRRHGPAAAWVRDRLLERRRRERRKAQKKRSPAALVARLDAWDPLREHLLGLGEVTEGLMIASLGAQWNSFTAMTRQFDLFAPQDPHELRIAGKLLRYTFEMLRRTPRKPPAVVVRTFKRMQDALGEWHDYVVLGEWAMRFSLDELLAHHDPRMQEKVLKLSEFALKRAARALRRFATLWERRGAQLSPLVAELVTPPRTGLDRSGSIPPTIPATAPPDASSAA